MKRSVKAGANPVLFLDRDGTINVDVAPDYLSDPANAALIPGVGKAIVRARLNGFKLAVVTNQAGVAKGLTRSEALPLIHSKLEGLIAREAGLMTFAFDDIQICMHHPDEKCRCRKPETGMLEAAAARLDADLARSFVVGDKLTDLVCADRLGLRSILVLTGQGLGAKDELERSPSSAVKPVGIVPSLIEAIELALRTR